MEDNINIELLANLPQQVLDGSGIKNKDIGPRRNWFIVLLEPSGLLPYIEEKMRYLLVVETMKEEGVYCLYGYVEFREPVRAAGVRRLMEAPELYVFFRDTDQRNVIEKLKKMDGRLDIHEYGRPGSRNTPPRGGGRKEETDLDILHELIFLRKELKEYQKALQQSVNTTTELNYMLLQKLK